MLGLPKNLFTKEAKEKYFAYRNIHKGKGSDNHNYSLRNTKSGRVEKRGKSFILKDVDFKVSEKGRERVRREKRKNVHAGVTGNNYTGKKTKDFKWERVGYNPYNDKGFTRADGSIITSAPYAKLTRYGVFIEKVANTRLSKHLAKKFYGMKPKYIAKSEYKIAKGASGKTGRDAFRLTSENHPKGSRGEKLTAISRGDALGLRKDKSYVTSEGEYANEILKSKRTHRPAKGNKDRKGRLKDSIAKRKEVSGSAVRKRSIINRGVGDLDVGTAKEITKRRKEQLKTYLEKPEVHEKLKKYRKKWYRKPGNREKVKKYSKQYRKEYEQRPEVKARRAELKRERRKINKMTPALPDGWEKKSHFKYLAEDGVFIEKKAALSPQQLEQLFPQLYGANRLRLAVEKRLEDDQGFKQGEFYNDRHKPEMEKSASTRWVKEWIKNQKLFPQNHGYPTKGKLTPKKLTKMDQKISKIQSGNTPYKDAKESVPKQFQGDKSQEMRDKAIAAFERRFDLEKKLEKTSEFKSHAQRRKFYALKAEGKMDQATIDEWEADTPKNIPKKLEKTAGGPGSEMLGMPKMAASRLAKELIKNPANFLKRPDWLADSLNTSKKFSKSNSPKHITKLDKKLPSYMTGGGLQGYPNIIKKVKSELTMNNFRKEKKPTLRNKKMKRHLKYNKELQNSKNNTAFEATKRKNAKVESKASENDLYLEEVQKNYVNKTPLHLRNEGKHTVFSNFVKTSNIKTPEMLGMSKLGSITKEAWLWDKKENESNNLNDKELQKYLKNPLAKKGEGHTFLKTAGGPGSGVDGDNTAKIDMPMTPHITIMKRTKFMNSKKPFVKDKKIQMSSIKYVGQEKYVPKKLNNFIEAVNNKESWPFEKPIDVTIDSNGDYAVLDGHHRYLTSKHFEKKTIQANVYLLDEKLDEGMEKKASTAYSRHFAEKMFKSTPKQQAAREYIQAMKNSGKTGRDAFRSIAARKTGSRGEKINKLSRGDALGFQPNAARPKSQGDYATEILKYKKKQNPTRGIKDSKGRVKETIATNKKVRDNAARRKNVVTRGVGDLALGTSKEKIQKNVEYSKNPATIAMRKKSASKPDAVAGAKERRKTQKYKEYDKEYGKSEKAREYRKNWKKDNKEYLAKQKEYAKEYRAKKKAEKMEKKAAPKSIAEFKKIIGKMPKAEFTNMKKVVSSPVTKKTKKQVEFDTMARLMKLNDPGIHKVSSYLGLPANFEKNAGFGATVGKYAKKFGKGAWNLAFGGKTIKGKWDPFYGPKATGRARTQYTSGPLKGLYKYDKGGEHILDMKKPRDWKGFLKDEFSGASRTRGDLAAKRFAKQKNAKIVKQNKQFGPKQQEVNVGTYLDNASPLEKAKIQRINNQSTVDFIKKNPALAANYYGRNAVQKTLTVGFPGLAVHDAVSGTADAADPNSSRLGNTMGSLAEGAGWSLVHPLGFAGSLAAVSGLKSGAKALGNYISPKKKGVNPPYMQPVSPRNYNIAAQKKYNKLELPIQKARHKLVETPVQAVNKITG